MDSRHSVNIITLKQRHPSRAEYFIRVLLDPSVVSNGSFSRAVNSADARGLTQCAGVWEGAARVRGV